MLSFVLIASAGSLVRAGFIDILLFLNGIVHEQYFFPLDGIALQSHCKRYSWMKASRHVT